MSKNINIKTQIIFPILILSILSLTISQQLEKLEIGQIIKGDMQLDESHKYYELKIPKSEAGKVLIITTQEDSLINKDIKDSFSDPDFYVSKKINIPLQNVVLNGIVNNMALIFYQFHLNQ
jgi:hypothetical protein